MMLKARLRSPSLDSTTLWMVPLSEDKEQRFRRQETKDNMVSRMRRWSLVETGSPGVPRV